MIRWNATPPCVLDDVLDDYVSIDAARDEYGVVIIGAGADLRVDERADRPRCAATEARVIAFTPEQEEFRRTVARFVDAEVAPQAEAIDERGEFPREVFKRLGAQGWLGLRYPERVRRRRRATW